MFVIINGERRSIAATCVDALLSELEHERTHLAVAVNHEVVPRSRWATTSLADGDTIEIITARQGG
jgi:sulfur carrier protein